MTFIPAKCTQCGSKLEVDDGKDAGVCPYCGTAFVTEKAIKNYNTFVTNNLVLDEETKKALLASAAANDLDSAAAKCKELYDLGNYSMLDKESAGIIRKWPSSPIGYMYDLMTYPEYIYFGTQKYENCLQNRKSTCAVHPMTDSYSYLMRCLDTDEEKNEYKEFTDKIKNIIDDFNAILNKYVAKMKLTRNIVIAVSLLLTVVSIFLCVFLGFWFIFMPISLATFLIIFLIVISTLLQQYIPKSFGDQPKDNDDPPK